MRYLLKLAAISALSCFILTSICQAQLANTMITFTSRRDGNDEIYIMSVDGTNQIRLTNNPAQDIGPSWSPDGTKIAFFSNRHGNGEIYVMNIDGTDQTRLTNNPADDRDPYWSPDGTKITFTSTRDGNYEIYVMNADGTNQTRLTNNTADDINSSWSPDGRRIVFNSRRDGNWETYIMNADGTNQINLSNTRNVDESWSFLSPDGTKIAFDAGAEIYVVNVDWTNLTPLINRQGYDAKPSWSPDGTKIAFVSERDGNGEPYNEIYMVSVDGTNQIRLTNNASYDSYPYWSPFLSPSATQTLPPAAPKLIAYAPDPTNNNKPTLVWPDVSGAVKYHIQIDDNSDFSSPVVDDSTLTSGTYTSKVALSDGRIYWRVGAIDASGRESGFSTPDDFVIDAIPPTAIPIFPTQNALNVPRNTNISVAFNKDMNPSSFTSSTFVVNGRQSGWHAGSFSYDAVGKRIRFTSSRGFAYGEVVTVTLTTGIKSAGGTSLTKGFLWTFSIEAKGGSGVFSGPKEFDLGGWFVTPTAADMDNDGDIDIAALSQNILSILLNDGKGNFAVVAQLPVPGNPLTFHTGDMDRDGDIDLLLSMQSGANILMKNNGNAIFTSAPISVSLPGGGDPHSSIGDLDADGDIDIVVSTRTSWEAPTVTISILKNNGSGNFNLVESYVIDGKVSRMIPADLDSDGDLDLVAVHDKPSGRVSILKNSGNGNFVAPVYYPVSAWANGGAVNDLDGDADVDVVVFAAWPGRVFILKNNGDGTFAAAQGYDVPSHSEGSGSLVDVDGDRDLDLVFTSVDIGDANSPSHIEIFKNSGNGIFAAGARSNFDYRAPTIASADFDVDGFIDVVQGANTIGKLFIFYNVIDTTPPIGSISINSGAERTKSTSVTLTLSAQDAITSVLQMSFSNDGTIYSDWEKYPTSKSWTLTSQDGTKTVYVKYKDTAGNISQAYSDTIVLDTTPPAIPTLIAYTPDPTDNPKPTLDWNDVLDATVYHIQIDNDSDFKSPIVDDAAVKSSIYSVSSSLPNGIIYWRVSSIDITGNESVFSEVDAFIVQTRVPSASASTISVSPTSVSTDSTTGATVTITLLDANGNPVSGKTVTIAATGTGNTITQPAAATNASGQTTATIKSTKAETKTISAINITDNITLTNTATVTFTAGAVSASASTIAASPTSAVADNTAAITVTVTLKDANGNPVSGKNVTISATGTNNTITQPASATDSNGQATATIKSTKEL